MKQTAQPSVEIYFTETPDGLVVDRITLRPTRQADEADLSRFAQRVRSFPLPQLGAGWEDAR